MQPLGRPPVPDEYTIHAMSLRSRGTNVGADEPRNSSHLCAPARSALAGASVTSTVATSVAKLRPAHVVVAVPVCAASSCAALAREVDEVVCLEKPQPFHAVGLWYDDFSETTDDEVRRLLADARAPATTQGGHDGN